MKGKETRDRLLDAGIRAIQKKSYHAVGIKEVLDAVGVPKGSFYYYFSSKEDFGIQAIRKFVGEHVAWIDSFLADDALPPPARLRRYFESCKSYYERYGFCQGCLVSGMSAEAGNLSPAIRSELRAGLEAFRDAYARFLQAGGTETKEALHTADLLLDAWEGAVLRMQITESLEPLDRFINGLLKLLCK